MTGLPDFMPRAVVLPMVGDGPRHRGSRRLRPHWAATVGVRRLDMAMPPGVRTKRGAARLRLRESIANLEGCLGRTLCGPPMACSAGMLRHARPPPGQRAVASGLFTSGRR
jgi:hypothetical protein